MPQKVNSGKRILEAEMRVMTTFEEATAKSPFARLVRSGRHP